MNERDVIKSAIDMLFLIKGQLKSEETALLRSILSIAIMEAEDLRSDFHKNMADQKIPLRQQKQG